MSTTNGIEYQGLKATTATTSVSDATGVFAGSRWAARYADAERRERYRRLAVPVVETLDRKLSALETALSRFQWPADAPPGIAWSRARLAVDEAEPPLQGLVSASLPTGDDRYRSYKYFSRGFDPDADAGILENTTLRFTVSQGGDSRTLSVDASPGDTWGDILAATAEAVNDSTLAVQAEVIEQPVAYRALPFLGKTGSILALSVDPARSGQDVGLQNGSGNLLLDLDMEAVSVPADVAPERSYRLLPQRAAAPTTIVSDGFLPVETTTLSAGDYDLGWTLGPHSGTATVTVTDGMDWRDVLRATADAVNGSTTLVNAEVVDTTVPTGLTGALQPATAQGLALAVQAADPKLGQRLALDDGGGLTAALGLEGTAEPGADALLGIDGRDAASASGRFRADLGRLDLQVNGISGRELPLSVVEPMREIESRVLDIVTAYNDARSFLLANADLFRSDPAGALQKPVRDGALDLAGLGVSEITDKDMLAVDRTRFWTALGENPERARQALADAATGLVPGLKKAVAGVRAPNLADTLATPTLLADAWPAWQQAFANEKAETMLDLVDNPTESNLAWKRVLELGGTLLDTIDAKRKA